MATSDDPTLRWYNLSCAALFAVTGLALLGFLRLVSLEAGAATNSAGLIGRAPLQSAFLFGALAAGFGYAAIHFRQTDEGGGGVSFNLPDFGVRLRQLTGIAEEREAESVAGKIWDVGEEAAGAKPAAAASASNEPGRRPGSGRLAAVDTLETGELMRRLESDRAKLAHRGD